MAASTTLLICFLFSLLFQSSLSTRMLSSSLKNHPLTFTYHNGPLLTGPIPLNLIWYGNFTPTQRAIVSDFVTSLPTFTTWWTTLGEYYYEASTPLPILTLGDQILDESCSLGKSLRDADITHLASNKDANNAVGVNVVLTAGDVLVEGFCMSRCGTHGANYIWVGNSVSRCPGQCAWPFHAPIYGPQTAPLVAPNGDVGVDGMVVNLAGLVAGTLTNPFGNGFYQGPKTAPLEAATACAGVFGRRAYPGYAGELLVDTVTGGSYNAHGAHGRNYLLPGLFDPRTASCSTPV